MGTEFHRVYNVWKYSMQMIISKVRLKVEPFVRISLCKEFVKSYVDIGVQHI